MDKEHLLQRAKGGRGPRKSSISSDSDDDEYLTNRTPQSDIDGLPYGGKVEVARYNLDDPFFVKFLEMLALTVVVCVGVYSYLHYDDVMHKLHLVYAHMGHSEAQHIIGQRYLQGLGVEKDHRLATEWLKKAADAGHPEASYNLAIAHMKKITKLKKGFVQ